MEDDQTLGSSSASFPCLWAGSRSEVEQLGLKLTPLWEVASGNLTTVPVNHPDFMTFWSQLKLVAAALWDSRAEAKQISILNRHQRKMVLETDINWWWSFKADSLPWPTDFWIFANKEFWPKEQTGFPLEFEKGKCWVNLRKTALPSGWSTEGDKILQSRSRIQIHLKISRVDFSSNLIWIIEEPSAVSHAAWTLSDARFVWSSSPLHSFHRLKAR